MENSYYKSKISVLITKLKTSCGQLFDVIEREIDETLQDDKLLNVLKAKRMAAEDSVWIMKRIDELEAELSGKAMEEESNTELESLNPAKRFSKKQ